jgi:hypothetical protein
MPYAVDLFCGAGGCISKSGRTRNKKGFIKEEKNVIDQCSLKGECI